MAEQLLSNVEFFIDLSGLESLTDYGIYTICNGLKMNKKINNGKQIRFDVVKLGMCSYVSVWGLHYLALASGKTLLDMHTNEFTVCILF